MQAGDLLLSDTALNAPEEDKFLNANVTPRADRANTEVIAQAAIEIESVQHRNRWDLCQGPSLRTTSTVFEVAPVFRILEVAMLQRGFALERGVSG